MTCSRKKNELTSMILEKTSPASPLKTKRRPPCFLNWSSRYCKLSSRNLQRMKPEFSVPEKRTNQTTLTTCIRNQRTATHTHIPVVWLAIQCKVRFSSASELLEVLRGNVLRSGYRRQYVLQNYLADSKQIWHIFELPVRQT